MIVNGNFAGPAFCQPSNTGSPAYLRNSLGLPLRLACGATARLAHCLDGLPQMSVVDGHGRPLLQTRAQSGSVQIDPEGQLAFSDGYLIVRWDPATRRTQSFSYSYPDHYGNEQFDAMLALPRGRTLVVGTAGQIGSHLLSVHEPDGSLRMAIDLSEGGDETAIEDIFASPDRQRVYLSCQRKESGRTGHAVFRLDLCEEGQDLRKLYFRETLVLYQDRAVVTEGEEILLLRPDGVKRLSKDGADQGSYGSPGALRQVLGEQVRPAGHVPLENRPSKGVLKEFLGA